MIGYKIVFKSGGRLVSTWSPAVCEYLPGVWVEHQCQCGPLCVFSDLDSARREFLSNGSFEIWECEYVASSSVIVWLYSGPMKSLTDLPRGTALASRVRLIRRIEG